MDPTAKPGEGQFELDLGKLDLILAKCNSNGRCQKVCPTYKLTDDLERQSPLGRIGELRLFRQSGQASADFDVAMSTCLSCRACETACPIDLPLGWVYDSGKLLRHQNVPPTTTEKTLQKNLVSYLGTVSGLEKLHRKLKSHQGSFMQKLVRSSLVQAVAPRDLKRMEAMLPPIDAVPSRVRLPRVTAPSDGGPAVLRVGLFVGCVGDIAYGSIHDATVRVLAASGCEVHVLVDQVCCGAVHSHVGQADQTREQLLANAAAFGFGPGARREPLDAIVSNAAGCGAMLKEARHYCTEPHVMQMSQTVRDVHELLYSLWHDGLGRQPRLTAIEGLSAVTYQDACHLRHGQRIATQPRWLLSQIPDLRIEEMRDAADCCGGAGVYNMVQPEMSDALGSGKLAHINDTGCDSVAVGNLVCIGQFSWAARRAGQELKLFHPVELLARALA